MACQAININKSNPDYMRISHSHKYIFLANPRSGSTTVRKILDDYSDIKSVHKSEITDEFPFYNHISALELKSIFDKRGWHWDRYKRFCVIRNPYDRVVSLFHHNLGMIRNPISEGIENLIKNAQLSAKPDPAIKYYFKQYVMGIDPNNVLTTSLEHFLCDADGHFLVEDILMFETLGDDLPSYLNELGISITSRDIPNLNSSEYRREYKEYYDDQSKKRITELYRYEIERFGYSF